ncbi:hypothetical protein [Pseudomonas sp. YuFO8]|uniref:hypothetical protein n=1 Tax=Pseudomonas sp. YuFO8 TaxID=3095361 RepID=UPI002B241F4A|nr:hypothetical protein [Pseudomonas sp. YuFO8]MEB2621382.1 hypothetical protein [Pseudomonas sp. YuFO8]
MSNQRFKLPANLARTAGATGKSGNSGTDALELARERTRQAEIKRDTAFSADRTQVLSQGIGLLRDLMGVLQSAIELGKTVTEWNGRVRAAQEAVNLAQKKLEQIRATNAPVHRQLDQVDLVLNECLKVFGKLEAVMDPSLIADDNQREIRATMEVYMGRMVELIQAGKR